MKVEHATQRQRDDGIAYVTTTPDDKQHGLRSRDERRRPGEAPRRVLPSYFRDFYVFNRTCAFNS